MCILLLIGNVDCSLWKFHLPGTVNPIFQRNISTELPALQHSKSNLEFRLLKSISVLLQGTMDEKCYFSMSATFTPSFRDINLQKRNQIKLCFLGTEKILKHLVRGFYVYVVFLRGIRSSWWNQNCCLHVTKKTNNVQYSIWSAPCKGRTHVDQNKT